MLTKSGPAILPVARGLDPDQFLSSLNDRLRRISGAISDTEAAITALQNVKPATVTPFAGLTGWTAYVPTVAAVAPMVATTTTVAVAEYLKTGNICFIRIMIYFATSGTAGPTVTVSLPSVAPVDLLGTLACTLFDGATLVAGTCTFLNSATLQVQRFDGGAFSLGLSESLMITGYYHC